MPDSLTCDLTDIDCHLDNARFVLDDFALSTTEFFMSGFVSVIETIPVPAFATNLSTMQLPPGILWVASALEMQSGIAIMVSAWTIRFLIRRIPVIG